MGCRLLGAGSTRTLTLRPSAVVSSNCSPRVQVISVDLKVDSVLMVTLVPSTMMICFGLMVLPILRVTKPTPTRKTK